LEILGKTRKGNLIWIDSHLDESGEDYLVFPEFTDPEEIFDAYVVMDFIAARTYRHDEQKFHERVCAGLEYYEARLKQLGSGAMVGNLLASPPSENVLPWPSGWPRWNSMETDLRGFIGAESGGLTLKKGDRGGDRG